MNMVSKETIDKIVDLWEISSKELEYIERGSWEVDHKYENRETIVKYQDKYYCILENRSGSYFTDYEYNDPFVYEVQPIKVEVTKWAAIK